MKKLILTMFVMWVTVDAYGNFGDSFTDYNFCMRDVQMSYGRLVGCVLK